MIRWHHQLDGHEFEQTLGDSEGQGNLACCSPWGCRESDMTERLNHSNKVGILTVLFFFFFLTALGLSCVHGLSSCGVQV